MVVKFQNNVVCLTEFQAIFCKYKIFLQNNMKNRVGNFLQLRIDNLSFRSTRKIPKQECFPFWNNVG